MKLKKFITTGLAAVGILFAGGVLDAQTAITNVWPNGTYQFQSASALTFTANASANVTSISVLLTSTNLLTKATAIANYTSAKGLTITGPATSESVSAPVKTNMLYSAVIQITDGNGNTVSTNITFDTIAPAYTFEAEDYDYTTNGLTDQFFDNPQTNAYAGVTSTPGVDANNPLNGSGQPNGSSAYRVNSVDFPALATEGNGDNPPRAQYIGTGKTDYDWGYTGGGEWGNYTRNYPAGVYNVFVRAANPNGASANAGDFSVINGTATFAANGSTGPYYFSVPTTGGWQNYVWCPVVDSSNNLAQLTLDGSQTTLRLTCDNASFNADYYMLVPANTNAPVAGSVVITNIYPDGKQQFQQTNTFSFAANDTNDIDPDNITVTLTGTTLLGSNTVAVLTVGDGLAVTGPSTNLTVTADGALSADTTYSAAIQIIDSNGNSTTTNLIFDTVSPNYYTFEARDNDYGGGLFFDNPQTNAYTLQDGIPGVDYVDSNPNPGYANYQRFGLGCDANCGDVPRAPYINTGFKDYDVGNIDVGDWGNYSRTYPAGVYNIYMRVASPTGMSADAASVSIVTPTTPNTSSQTLSKLGTFVAPATGDWQKYAWVVLRNSAGYPAQFNVGSTPTVYTLRVTTDKTGYNTHFYMLVPADLSVHNPPFINGFQPDGTTMFQMTNLLSFTVNSQAGITPSGITLNLNGVNQSGLATSGSANLMNVTFPIQSNQFYTAIVTVTDAYGTSSSTNVFDTFDPNTYTFEAEDYDYNGGQFMDNPQTDAYSGLSGIINVDDFWDYNVAGGNSYRVSSGAEEGLATEQPSGDWLRPQYSTTGALDYDIGHNDGGNWANYTRTYPAGTYNIWIRSASPNPNGGTATTDAAKVSLVTGGWGTTSQTTTELGTFTTPNTGDWHKFGWAPLMDANGNYAKYTFDGSTNTLKVTVDNGGYNVDFYALVPANTTRPVITGLYPNGTTLFQATNALSFNAVSSSGIDTNDITVTLNGTPVTGLVFTGSSTNWNVNYVGLQPNTAYTAVITVVSPGGLFTETANFDTYASTNYQWEAEDWDYTSNGVSGLFIDNPQVDAYAGLASTAGADAAQLDNGVVGSGGFNYRPYDGVNLVPGTTVATGEGTRPQFGTNADYRLTWFGYGSSCNYTRHYPAGTYNIIGRFTEGTSNTVATLSEVKAANGNPAGLLGTFYIPYVSGANFNTWEYVPLADANGNPVAVTLDGLQNTLQLDGNPVAANDPTINVGFFMLVPTTQTPAFKLTASMSGGKMVVSFPTQDASYTYQLLYKSSLTDANWTALGSVSGNGSVQSITNAVSGNTGFYRVQQTQ